jgi:hypothetical protein
VRWPWRVPISQFWRVRFAGFRCGDRIVPYHIRLGWYGSSHSGFDLPLSTVVLAVEGVLGGLAGNPGEKVVVDLVGLFQVQEMAGAADDDHAGGRGEEGPGAVGEVCGDAAVVGPCR